MNKNNLIRYANCWEDPDNLLDHLKIGKNVLSICSGGDNTLSLLLKNPKQVVAFDTNINQIYMLKLKISAIRTLTYGEVLILLGVKKGDAYREFLKLENDLGEDAFNFFKSNKDFFDDGLINVGKFEKYFQLFRKYICPLFTSRKRLAKLVGMRDLSAQWKYYEEVINNRRLKGLFKIFFGFRVMGKYGRDKAFYDYVPDKEKSAKDIKQRFDWGMKNIINYSNPYINYILLNEFGEECLPKYLVPENYEIIKSRLDKISFLHGSLLDVSGKYDFFNLSDIFEYMSEEDFRQNITQLKQIANPNSLVLYYNMQNMRYIEDENFRYLEKESRASFKKNKSYFYRDFLVYKRDKSKNE